jgi:hypothetical protein
LYKNIKEMDKAEIPTIFYIINKSSKFQHLKNASTSSIGSAYNSSFNGSPSYSPLGGSLSGNANDNFSKTNGSTGSGTSSKKSSDEDLDKAHLDTIASTSSSPNSVKKLVRKYWLYIIYCFKIESTIQHFGTPPYSSPLQRALPQHSASSSVSSNQNYPNQQQETAQVKNLSPSRNGGSPPTTQQHQNDQKQDHQKENDNSRKNVKNNEGY